MKKFIFLLLCCLAICEKLTAQDLSLQSLRFCKEIPSAQAEIMLARINAFGETLQGDDYSSLEYLWDNPFDEIKFDGNFCINYMCLDYLNSNPDLPRKYGKADQSITLSHWAGKEYEEYGPNISQNYVVLCFLDSTKIGSYYEFGKVVNEYFGVRFVEKTGVSDMFQLSIKHPAQNKTADSILLEWDKNEKMVSGENLQLINNMRLLPAPQNVKNLKTKWGKVSLIPDIPKNKELKVFFNRMIQIMTAKKKDEMIELMDFPLTKQVEQRYGQVSFRDWRCQWGCFLGKNYLDSISQGYAYAKNHDGMPTLYLEGKIIAPDKFDGVPSLYETGIIIRFHPTGYPASYKTIVNNRLFGRQIEWNDKGEVLSDVDLDIPKPWADAPKKEEDTGQKK